MEDKKAPTNVLQFPGRKKEEAEAKPSKNSAAARAKSPKKPRGQKKNLIGSVLAISIFTAAINGYVYSQQSGSQFSSMSRGIASVEMERSEAHGKWEQKLVKSLSAPVARGVASMNIGRAPTAIEKLRFGTLEEKYTITYQQDDQLLRSISLQDEVSSPAYVRDRARFISEYGHLMNAKFASSSLDSVESADGKTVESYTLFDKDHKAAAQAFFELDRHSRLISLKVEPVQI